MRARTSYVKPSNTRLTGEKSLLNIRFRCRSEQILAISLGDIARAAPRGGFCSSCPNDLSSSNTIVGCIRLFNHSVYPLSLRLRFTLSRWFGVFAICLACWLTWMLLKTENVPKTCRKYELTMMIKMACTNLLMLTNFRKRFKKNLVVVMSIVDRRRCVRMNSSSFLNFWFFFKLFFFIRVLIFFRFRRDHYFFRGRLMIDMHSWKRRGVSIQRRWHNMLSNRSRDFRAKIFISMISIRTLSVR